MIIVYGSIMQLIRIESDPDQRFEQFEFTKHYKNSVGGKAALQAVAAAKAGAKIAICGKMGDDELAKHILARLRKHGVITSAVGKTETIQTGTAIRLEHEERTIIALGANTRASAEQLPNSVLHHDTILMLQTELDAENNSELLERAKEQGATTILNISPKFQVSQEDLKNVDYAILSIKHKDKWSRIAGPLTENGQLTTIFICPYGDVEVLTRGKSSLLPEIQSDKLNWAYPEAFEDVFCGTFAAGLYAGQPLPKVLTRAHMAAALCASKPGGYDTLPYSGEVDEGLKDLEENKD
ncbi:MAG: PfkB family carbohydrate kinase [Pseudomonadota bacterium]